MAEPDTPGEESEESAPAMSWDERDAAVVNVVDEPIVPDKQYDPRRQSFLHGLNQVKRASYIPDILADTGPWKAIVLRVESSNADPSTSDFHNTDSQPSTEGSENDEAADPDNVPTLVLIKARIPMLDAALPQPPELGDISTTGISAAIISHCYENTFVAQTTAVAEPAVGEEVWVTYQNNGKGQRANGIYLKPVDEYKYLAAMIEEIAGSAAFGGGGGGPLGAGTGNTGKNAVAEWEKWCGAHEKDVKTNPKLRAELIKYWRAVDGTKISDKKIYEKRITIGGGKDGPTDTKSQWSAAFITYSMRDDPSFKKLCRGGCGGHFNYVNGGMINRMTQKSGWMTFLASEWKAAGLKIAPGMLICSGHCDLVVDENTMIGGNTYNAFGGKCRKGSDTVGRQKAVAGIKGRNWVMKRIKPGEKIPRRPSDMKFQQKGLWVTRCGKVKKGKGVLPKSAQCTTTRKYIQAQKAPGVKPFWPR